MQFQYADKLTRAADVLISEALEASVPAALRKFIQDTFRAGYELGLAEGQENLEAACDASFDSGWQNAEEQCKAEALVDGLDAHADGYDDGYLHGVQDARANPKLADETVQDIINVRAEEHMEALEPWCGICQQHGCAMSGEYENAED